MQDNPERGSLSFECHILWSIRAGKQLGKLCIMRM